MRRFRLSIAGLIGVVALSAFDAWIYRRTFEAYMEAASAEMPTTRPSSPAPLDCCPRRTSSWSLRPFSWLGSAVPAGVNPSCSGFSWPGCSRRSRSCFVMGLTFESLLVAIDSPGSPLRAPTFDTTESENHRFLLGFMGLAALPQVLIAFVGGLVFRSLGVNVCLSGRTPNAAD